MLTVYLLEKYFPASVDVDLQVEIFQALESDFISLILLIHHPFSGLVLHCELYIDFETISCLTLSLLPILPESLTQYATSFWFVNAEIFVHLCMSFSVSSNFISYKVMWLHTTVSVVIPAAKCLSCILNAANNDETLRQLELEKPKWTLRLHMVISRLLILKRHNGSFIKFDGCGAG